MILSLYDFNAINWAWQLEDIGNFYGEYRRLMQHWHAVLPLRMFEVSYEQLVGDQEAVSRELIDFCGLDWDDRCLEFYRDRRPVQSASRVQVRQPMYSSSIGRWRKYSKHLLPLERAINDQNEDQQ